MSSKLLNLTAAALLLPAHASVAPRAQETRAVARAGRAGDCGLPARSRKVDEYGPLPAAEEQSRLEKLAAALKAEDEDTVAFIIGYAGRDGRPGGGLARADRAKQQIVEKTYFYNPRLNTLDCGRREAPATEIWLTPAGASPPPCSPTLDPTPAPAAGGAAPRRPRRRSGRL